MGGGLVEYQEILKSNRFPRPPEKNYFLSFNNFLKAGDEDLFIPDFLSRFYSLIKTFIFTSQAISTHPLPWGMTKYFYLVR